MIWLTAWIGTIFAANWAISTIGLVPVGFGLMAPAGVYFVGLAFTFRDLTQESLGKGWTLFAIVAGAGLSALISPALALASGSAFLFSELADFAVYTPLRTRNLPLALAASNTVGLVADSIIFLALAFGSLEFLAGQVVGKAWMTLAALPVIYLARRRLVHVPRVVYLAGGINGLSDSDASDWREYAKARLNFDTLDPMRRDYRGREDESVDEIVHGDLDDINASDVVLASCVRPSWGTAMEIHHAGEKGMPVYSVVPEGQPVSPWLRYFSTQVFRSFDEAIDTINGELTRRGGGLGVVAGDHRAS